MNTGEVLWWKETCRSPGAAAGQLVGYSVILKFEAFYKVQIFATSVLVLWLVWLWLIFMDCLYLTLAFKHYLFPGSSLVL